jgi:flagellar biosynthesis/type III secretory pathway ATPase
LLSKRINYSKNKRRSTHDSGIDTSTHVFLEIVGDTVRVRASKAAFGELALIENNDGIKSLARVVGLDQDIVTLQIFGGSKGISTDAKWGFLASFRCDLFRKYSRQDFSRFW